MIPSGYKEDVVYSEIPINGAGDLAFTRASNGTRINSQGLVEVCPWNLLEQSNTFSTSPWANTNVTLTSGQTDPNGGATAFRAQFSGVSYLLQNLTALNGTNSIYAKAYGSTAKIRLCDPNGSFGTQYNLTTEWQRITTSGNALAGISIDSYIDGGWTSQDIVIAFAQTNIGSTAKPYFPTTDRLNVPRLTYQNGGGGCPSLLLEKQSTNLVTYSEQFDNADWTKLQTSISANSVTSPDGTTNADTLTADGSSNEHQLRSTGIFTITSGQAYTTSIFAKAGTNNFVQLIGSGAIFSATTYANFNIATGVIGDVGAGTTAKIDNLGNGWYRCSMIATAISTTSTNTFLFNIVTSNTAIRGESNTLSTSVYVWGAQVEASSYPTSYIPTTSASATRVADTCFKTGITSLIGQTEGVMFVDWNFTGNYDVSGILAIQLITGSSFAYIYIQSSGSLIFELWDNGFQQSIMTSTIGAIGRKKMAFAYKQNDFAAYMNGTQLATDTSGTVGAMGSLYVGGGNTSNYAINGGMNQAILFPTRLTNAELASITSL